MTSTEITFGGTFPAKARRQIIWTCSSNAPSISACDIPGLAMARVIWRHLCGFSSIDTPAMVCDGSTIAGVSMLENPDTVLQITLAMANPGMSREDMLGVFDEQVLIICRRAFAGQVPATVISADVSRRCVRRNFLSTTIVRASRIYIYSRPSLTAANVWSQQYLVFKPNICWKRN